jgi:NAD(P)-dependent dehydrogenase (short-subunit alcohol dehydrogenase family)
MKYEIPQMIKQGKGAIVNNASVAGLRGFSGMPAYVASKHGVIGLTKSAALECAQLNIRINAVCPGAIRTPMLDRYMKESREAEKELIKQEPIGRLGEPEEIANAALWLCSDAASFITGQAIPVDGGWLA